MSVLAALIQDGRTVLLQNIDAEALQAEGAISSETAAERARSALNSAGLAQLWSAPNCALEQEKLLVDCSDVCSGLAQLERAVDQAPARSPGCVLLADIECIALVDYAAGQTTWETRERGFLLRDTDGSAGPPDASSEETLRGEQMRQRVEELYAWLPMLDEEDVAERARAILQQEPIWQPHTVLSVFVDVEVGRVHWCRPGTPWQTDWSALP